MTLRTHRALRSIYRPTLALRRSVLCLPPFQRHNNASIICSSLSQRKYAHTNPADDPEWTSFIDNPPVLMRLNQKHGPGLIILGEVACAVVHAQQ